MRVTEQATIAASALPQPLVTYHVGEKQWTLAADYRYLDAGDAHRPSRRITVPAGFCCDLSSVPRALWWLIGPHELSIVGPVLHDFLYRHGGQLPVGCVWPLGAIARAEADAIFRDAMQAEGVSAWRRWSAHQAVRLFGRGAWTAAAVAPAAPAPQAGAR